MGCYAVGQVIDDLDPAPQTFYGRNRVALERLGAALQSWNSGHAHDAVVQGAIAKMDAMCGKLPEGAPERAVCSNLLHPPSPPAPLPRAGEGPGVRVPAYGPFLRMTIGARGNSGRPE